MSDLQLRRLERQYYQDASKDNEEQYHLALKRSGLCETDANPMPYIEHVPLAITGQCQVTFRIYGNLPEVICPICKNNEFTTKLYYSANPGLAPNQVGTLVGATGL